MEAGRQRFMYDTWFFCWCLLISFHLIGMTLSFMMVSLFHRISGMYYPVDCLSDAICAYRISNILTKAIRLLKLIFILWHTKILFISVEWQPCCFAKFWILNYSVSSKFILKFFESRYTVMKNYPFLFFFMHQTYLLKLTDLVKRPSFQHVAIQCLCSLLEAVPHFNFRESLLASVVTNISSMDDVVRFFLFALDVFFL